VVSIKDHEQKEPSIMNVITVGLDLAKNVFQVHGIDETGDVVVRRSLRRGQVKPFFGRLEPCLIGMEACGTSHFWARELRALGHEVRLMPPGYVKPYVKRGKTDASDAEAIAEAVSRPTMRFVAIKSPEQQSVLALHRTRDLLVRQRTQLINMIRAQLAEFGIVLAKGVQHALKLVDRLVEGAAPDIPALACKIVIALAEQIRALQVRIATLEEDMKTWFLGNELAKRLATIPGIGVITASALAASVTDPHRFTSARRLARTDAEGRLQCWQAADGTHLQDGGPLSSPPAGKRDDIAASIGAAQAGGSSLGQRTVGQQARQAGRRRHGQQGRADRLGHHDAWRGLSRASSR
jgi:transposase